MVCLTHFEWNRIFTWSSIVDALTLLNFSFFFSEVFPKRSAFEEVFVNAEMKPDASSSQLQAG